MKTNSQQEDVSIELVEFIGQYRKPNRPKKKDRGIEFPEQQGPDYFSPWDVSSHREF